MNLANKITLLRICFIPAFMVLMYCGGSQGGVLSWIALGVFIVACITDHIDGYIARKYNQISDFGKFLDPLADKLLTIAAMVIFGEQGRMPGWALMIVLTREFAVTGLRLVAVGKGNVIAAGFSGKVKTASTMVGLCFMLAFPGLVWLDMLVNAVIVLTTVYSGVEYFVKNGQCLLSKE